MLKVFSANGTLDIYCPDEFSSITAAAARGGGAFTTISISGTGPFIRISVLLGTSIDGRNSLLLSRISPNMFSGCLGWNILG